MPTTVTELDAPKPMPTPKSSPIRITKAHGTSPFTTAANIETATNSTKPSRESKWNRFVILSRDLVDCVPVSLTIVILTLCALYMDDIRLWLLPKSADQAFSIFALLVFIIFTLEIVLNCIVKPRYVLRFFFWLDCLATLSMLPDILFIWEPMIDEHPSYKDYTATEMIAYTTSSAGYLATQFIRIIRLLRLFRIAKLFESFTKTNGKRFQRDRPSQVGQHLSEQTTRKVVILVLLMLFGIPLLQPIATNDALEYTMDELNALSKDSTMTADAWQKEISFILNFYGTALYLNVSSPYHTQQFTFIADDITKYRLGEVLSFESGNAQGLFSGLEESQLRGKYNLIITSFVLGLLAIGSLLFNRNNHKMVIIPIERMMATIVTLQQNPLAKASLTLSNSKRLSMDKNENIRSSTQNNETGMLERTLEKLTGLLQVGFGEAGSKMIQKCMNVNADGDLDPLVDGTKMLAVFGFCDIRRFTDATECLKEDVMMYVNEIAAIVHGQVSLADGNPNKNIGDAFLLVWRLPQEMEVADLTALYLESGGAKAQLQPPVSASTPSHSPLPSVKRTLPLSLRASVAILADKSLVSFLRVIVEIAANEELKKYAANPRIKAAFDDFEVQLGFGLHVGWAIEGPIGSRYKIDASYLSPHVNLAETLEGTTKTYGVRLLMSGEFYSMLSPYARAHCRQIDCVKTSGREAPLQLYTFDIRDESLNVISSDTTSPTDPFLNQSPSHYPAQPPSSLHPLSSPPSANGALPPTVSPYATARMTYANDHYPAAPYHLVRHFHLSALQIGIPLPFFDAHAQGFQAYIEGDWGTARQHFQRALQFYSSDKPTAVLLSFMAETSYIAPKTWNGYREL